MVVPPRQRVPPLNYRTPIVDPETGTPTLQHIQLWEIVYGNEEGTNADVSGLQSQIDNLDTRVDAVEADIVVIEADIATIEGDIVNLQASAVPPGGAAGEVLTKDTGTDYDMSWQPAAGGGGGIYAPMVTGGLPGPEPLATADGQFIMALIG